MVRADAYLCYMYNNQKNFEPDAEKNHIFILFFQVMLVKKDEPSRKSVINILKVTR